MTELCPQPGWGGYVLSGVEGDDEITDLGKVSGKAVQQAISSGNCCPNKKRFCADNSQVILKSLPHPCLGLTLCNESWEADADKLPKAKPK